MSSDVSRARRAGIATMAATVLVAGCTVKATTAPAPAYPAANLEPNVDRPGADYRSFDLPTPSPADCQSACMSDAACAAFTYVSPGVQGPNARCMLKNAVPQPVPQTCCVSGTKYANAPPPEAPPPAVPSPPPTTSWQGTPTTPTTEPLSPATGWQGTPSTPPPSTPPPAPEAAAPPPASGWQGRPTTPPPAPAPRQWEPQTDRPGSDYRTFDLRDPRPETCRDACWGEAQCRAFTYVRPGAEGRHARCGLKNVVPPARPADCCLSGVK
jgi:hypothetical protein